MVYYVYVNRKAYLGYIRRLVEHFSKSSENIETAEIKQYPLALFCNAPVRKWDRLEIYTGITGTQQ
jgi:hypothetical protein